MGVTLHPGNAAPWFRAQALSGDPQYAFHTVAGRFVLMLFHGSAGWPAARAALDVATRHRMLFDDVSACLFGVTIDPADAAQGHIVQQLPGIRWFLDYDRAVSRAYGAAFDEADGRAAFRPFWLLLDPMLRVHAVAPIEQGEAIVATLRAAIAGQGAAQTAPVLVVPNILEPDLCRRLIAGYERDGGAASGFMREEDGITVVRTDPNHKRRSDWVIDDEALREAVRVRLIRNLDPMMRRAFQFAPTRIERWLVARYDDGDGGFFAPHRDDTTKGTAHRRFACTINLNAGDYEGGDLCFPEFGPRTYRAATGGAVVFSCSLLHEARPVTRGRRYALLPFFYDEAAAKLREANMPFVSPEIAGYRAG